MVNLYLDTLVFGLQKIGGVSVVWYEYLTRMLKDSNINLTLLDINGEYININFKNLDTTTACHIKEQGKSLQILRNRNPVFQVPKQTAIFQSTYLRVCKQKNVKNVVMIHDITHQLYFKGIKKWLNTFQKKKAIYHADGILCVSESTLNDLHKYFPETRNIKAEVVYNSASTDYRVLDNPKFPNKYKILNGKKYVIYVGDRFPYKNTGFLNKILKERTDLFCVLIGGADFSIKEKRDMRGIQDRIIHFTGVSNQELNILYNNAFCMIFPSLYEGFGIPILEAMKTGCPVIAFHTSSIPELLQGTGYLLKVNDKKGCLKALRELENKEIREQVKAEELKAAEVFNWDNSYKKMVKFYEEILK